MIDTHAHIYLPDFNDSIAEVIARAKQAGVSKIFMPNIDRHSIDPMLQLEKQFADYCIPMMGLHPCYVKENYKEELRIADKWLNQRKFAAIGEIGTDLYWDTTYKGEQISAFDIQTEWARSLKLPIVIHCRDSMDLTIDLVEKHQDGKLRGIFHCFTGNLEQAMRIIDLGFLLGIGGVATFKNGGLDAVLPSIDLNHLVMETDSPYLAPTPHRGKRNEPGYLALIAHRIAELKECKSSEVIEYTTRNAQNLFGYGH